MHRRSARLVRCRRRRAAIRDPRRALEHVVREALLRPPCGVAFSGGRDSSAVLAVAAHVARRDGLPAADPDHEGLPRRADGRGGLVAGAGRATTSGSTTGSASSSTTSSTSSDRCATANLVEHGVVWPPTIHGDVPVVELVPRRLGDRRRGRRRGARRRRASDRAGDAPASRHHGRCDASRLRRAVGAVLPAAGARPSGASGVDRRIRCRGCARRAPSALAAASADDERRAPLSFARSVRRVPRRRSQVLGARNRQYFARVA